MMKIFFSNRAKTALCLSILLIAFSPDAQPQELKLGTVTPTPSPVDQNPFAQFVQQKRKPIAMKWKIGAVLVVLAIAGVALWISARVWKSSNLFDRQYRFPAVQSAAIRLGANRSGGQVATILFRNRAGPPSTR